jgi:hypothetical protein
MAIDVGRAAERQNAGERAVGRASSVPAVPTLARCPSCASGLARLDSGIRADVLLGLQRSRGNAFVGGLAAQAEKGRCTCGGRCGGGTLAREPKEVKARPKDPSKPMELMSYQCEPKRLFKVEIFTAMTSETLQTHIAKAAEVLARHNIRLEVAVKGISSKYYPIGYDVKVAEGEGTVTSKEAACKLIAATIEQAGHEAGTMPVFYIPCDPAALGAHAEGEHFKDADAELCESGGHDRAQERHPDRYAADRLRPDPLARARACGGDPPAYGRHVPRSGRPQGRASRVDRPPSDGAALQGAVRREHLARPRLTHH